MEGRFSTSNAVGIAANFHEACRLSSSLPHPPTDVAQNNRRGEQDCYSMVRRRRYIFDAGFGVGGIIFILT